MDDFSLSSAMIVSLSVNSNPVSFKSLQSSEPVSPFCPAGFKHWWKNQQEGFYRILSGSGSVQVLVLFWFLLVPGCDVLRDRRWMLESFSLQLIDDPFRWFPDSPPSSLSSTRPSDPTLSRLKDENKTFHLTIGSIKASYLTVNSFVYSLFCIQ